MAITLNGDTGIQTPMYNGTITANAVTPSVNMKNRIINGAMTIDQRNAGASLTNIASSQISVDRWRQNSSQASKFTVQQNAGSVTPPTGFTNYLGFTTTSAVTIASGDYFWFGTTVEGYNSADLNWGTANGKTVTVSFWAYASIVGSYTLLLKPGGGAYSYATSFSLTTANTWQYITVTIPPLTTGGAINTTNGTGIQVNFSLGMGSTYYTSTANTWVSGDFYALNGTVNTIATNGATFYITGVQLEVGSTATSFDYLDYGRILIQCQRYYAKMGAGGYSNYTALASGVATGSTNGNLFIKYPVTMRASATIAYSNVCYGYAAGTTTAISSVGSTYSGTDSMLAQPNASGASMTIGYACTLQADNNSAGYIELSAEL
jgi:hypothetical protein